MSDENNPQPTNSNDDPQPSTEPGSGETPATKPQDYRFGDDAPDYLKGKSPKEAVDIINNLVATINQQQQGGMQQQQQQSQLQRQQQQQAAQQMQEELDPDLILTDPAKWQQQFQKQLGAGMQQYLNQVAQPVLQQQAQTARYMSQNDPEVSDVWQDYGSEIEQTVSQIPAAQRTKELYDRAAEIVAGRHRKDLAQKEAQKQMAAIPQVERSNSNAPAAETSSGDDEFEALAETDYGKNLMQKFSKSRIKKNARAAGFSSVKEFAESISRKQPILDPSSPGTWTTQLG